MFLPKPPSLEEIQRKTPKIGLVPKGVHRPFWSVMIPTYNNGDYLRRTLNSVLCQDPGPDQMQIEVVDACSTKDDPEQIVKQLGRGRVSFYRLGVNRGSCHTFNVCIERSCGHWIHILHGDDMVMPGFYGSYAELSRKYPQAQTMVGQVVNIDEEDRWIGLSGPVPPNGGGLLQDFTERHATWVLVMCPAVIVRRDAYEAADGFCTLFESVGDWDMWFRLAQLAPVACVTHPKAFYRIHTRSETKRLMISASNIREAYFVVKTNIRRLNGEASIVNKKSWRSHLAKIADLEAWLLDNRNCIEGRLNQARWAWMLEPSLRRLIMLVKSWVKQKLLGKTPSP